MPQWPISRLQELLEPSLRHMGYELYGLSQGGPSGRTLRISIDSASGVSLDDCERVSNLAGPLIEHADLIPGPYTLEVSSPGAERPLRNRAEYDRFTGRKVNVHYQVGESEAVVEGHLVAVDDAGIAVRGKGSDVIHLGWEDIRSARLAIEF